MVFRGFGKKLTDPNYKPKKHWEYKSEGHIDFVIEETHYELDIMSGRSGKYSWDEQRNLFWDRQTREFIYSSSEPYQQAREKVLTGLVRRAVKLFTDWDGKTSPENVLDYRNLRGNLSKDLEDFVPPGEPSEDIL